MSARGNGINVFAADLPITNCRRRPLCRPFGVSRSTCAGRRGSLPLQDQFDIRDAIMRIVDLANIDKSS
ncbi:MAG: hypothetical protein ACKO14_15350, partial [Armatimonadota bacterium]